MTDHAINERRPLAVVGAAGFLGRSLIRNLDAQGRTYQSFTRSRPIVASGADSRAVLEACSTVVWMASSINPLVAESDPELAEADVASLQQLTASLLALKDPPRLVLLSSGGTIYGPGNTPPHRETDEPKPGNAYGRAKLRLEGVVRTNLDDYVIARVANAFGPGQPVARGQGVIAHWLRSLRRRESLRVYGDPATVRDYVFADDIADALLAIADAEAPPNVLNVGSGIGTSLADLLHELLRVVNLQSVSVEYAASRSFDVPASYLDMQLAQTSLGWTAKTTLRQGLEMSWDAVAKFGDPVS